MRTPWAFCYTPGCVIMASAYEAYEIHVFDNAGQEILARRPHPPEAGTDWMPVEFEIPESGDVVVPLALED